MITIVIVLLFLLVVAGVLIFALLSKNLQLSDQRELLVDQIEESLDELDSCYNRLAHNAEINVMSDEPVIREVMNDIKRSRNTVLKIASKVVTYGSDEEKKDE